MPYDALVQLAVDGAGKSVDMEQVSTAAGATLYRQRAVLVGESGDILQQIFNIQVQQLAILRAILAIHRSNNTGSLGEEDYSQDMTPNDY